MDVNRFYLTKAGLALEAKCKTGQPLTFTVVGLGAGEQRSLEQLMEMLTLADERARYPIDSVTSRNDGTARIHAILSNRNIGEGFHIREIGIYARDPDFGEILYAVCPAGQYTEWFSAATDRMIDIELEAIIVVGNAENLAVTISDDMVYATKRELRDVAGEKRTTENVWENAQRILALELQMLVLAGQTSGITGNRFMVDMANLTDDEDFGGVYFRERKELTI